MKSAVKLKCENCHAMIDAESPQCPYCGAINVSGSEKKYMEQLSDIKEDIEELEQIPVHASQKEMGKTGKIILITVAVLVVTVGIITKAYHFFDYIFTDIVVEDPKQKLLWERENYPVLDTMYENEDYDGILAFMQEHFEDAGYSVYNWDHYSFIDLYRYYEDSMYTAALIEEGNYDKDDIAWCIVDALLVFREMDYVTYTAKEEEQIAAYREEIYEVMQKLFGMTKEQVDKLYQDSCTEKEYGIIFDYDKAQKNAEKIAKKY